MYKGGVDVRTQYWNADHGLIREGRILEEGGGGKAP